MSKIKSFFIRIMPSKRKLIQLYAALLYNAHLMGYVTGNIFTGKSKVICLPGMNCYSCPGAIGACPLGSLQNALSSKNYKTITYVVGILLLYAISFGRMICGWFCPGGFFQELLYKIKTPKLKKNKITRVLSYFKYVLLFGLVIYLPIIFTITSGKTIPGFCKYICPIGTFEGALGLLANNNNANYFDMLGPLFTWKFILLVLFIVGSIFIYRIFCRFFCPLGAIYGLFNKLSILGIKVNEDKCNHCGACVSKCKMDVKHVGDHECIMCGECIDTCHAKAIDWKLIRKEINASIKEEGSSELVEDNNIEKPKKKINKKFLINGISTAVCLIILLVAILYSNINWNKSNTVSIGDKYTTLDVNYYNEADSFDIVSDDNVTLIFFYDNYNKEQFDEIYNTFKDKSLNIIAVSSYSNRELNKTYINDEYGFIFAYDSDKLDLLKSFGGNNYPYYVWLDKNDEIMYFSSLSFVEDLYSIDCAILGKKIGKEIGNVCISKNINLLDKDGNKGIFNVSKSQGKVRIINFWFTTCGPCIGEIPYFDAVANDERYKDKIEVIAIHDGMLYEESDYLDCLNKTLVKYSSIKYGYDDENSSYYQALGGNGSYPMTVIIDANGVITYKSLRSVTIELLEAEIEKALNN